MAFVLKFILSDVSNTTPAFFPSSFAWNIFSISSLFSLCKYFVLKRISCIQHIYGSRFLIHSATLCHLIAVFNPFTFEVIVDRYLFIAIFYSYLYSSLYFLFFLAHPFNISCSDGLLVMNSFNLFFGLRISLFHLQF